MTLRSFVDRTPDPAYTLAVVGDRGPAPMAAMLEDAFDELSVDVESRAVVEQGGGLESGSVDAPRVESAADSEAQDDVVVLLEEDEIVASSPLSAVYDHLLAINSDRFVTGAADLDDVVLPSVLSALAGSRFRVRGFPLAHKEKLLLILVSRAVERRAWTADGGTLRAGFQQLSRIEDEVGTHEAYERLAESDVDLHLYGVPNADPPSFEATVHRGRGPAYRNGWFVVFRPDDGGQGEPAALVAVEPEPRIWDGFWTFDPERVRAIDSYVAREL